MRKYILVDRASGEEIEADVDRVERVPGIEIGSSFEVQTMAG